MFIKTPKHSLLMFQRCNLNVIILISQFIDIIASHTFSPTWPLDMKKNTLIGSFLEGNFKEFLSSQWQSSRDTFQEYFKQSSERAIISSSVQLKDTLAITSVASSTLLNCVVLVGFLINHIYLHSVDLHILKCILFIIL